MDSQKTRVVWTEVLESLVRSPEFRRPLFLVEEQPACHRPLSVQRQRHEPGAGSNAINS